MDNTNEQFESFIELKNITVKSNGRVILSIPHAIIPADRITACIGPNGAGKTTLLKLLDGLIKPDTGTVSYSFANKTALVLHHTPMIKARPEQTSIWLGTRTLQFQIQKFCK